MQKVCKYGNAVVYISIGEHSYENIRKSTEKFLRRSVSSSTFDRIPSSNHLSDPTSKVVIMKDYYLERIEMIERSAMDADVYLYDYILKAVTGGLSYTYLKLKLDIPCGKDMFYDRYRKFFWLLSNSRN